VVDGLFYIGAVLLRHGRRRRRARRA
jgi:hypothetical protein